MTRLLRIRALAVVAGVAAAAGLCGAARTAAQEVCDGPWALEETLRLGSVDGDGMLTYVRDLAIGADGRVYLLQSWDPIRVFRPDGRPAGTIGRQGEGPGEWPSPLHGLGWRGDTLWVQHRLGTQFLSADGEEIRRVSFRIRLPREGSQLNPGRPLPDGTFLPGRTVNEDLHLFLKADRAALRRVSAAGEIVDTLAMVERRLGPFALEHETDRYGWGVMISHPLGPWYGESWLPVAATPDGSAVVLIGEVREDREDATFDLLRIRFDGDTLLRRAVPYEPRPITRAEQSLQRERMADRLARGGSPWDTSDPERKRRIGRELISFPEHYPPCAGSWRAETARSGSSARRGPTRRTCGRSTTRTAGWRDPCASRSQPIPGTGTRASGSSGPVARKSGRRREARSMSPTSITTASTAAVADPPGTFAPHRWLETSFPTIAAGGSRPTFYDLGPNAA